MTTESTGSAPQPRIGKSLLVVDDDAAYRNALIRVLARDGWTCEGVASGAVACDIARSRSFDLALVDCWMPAMSGFETLHALRAADPLLPIVMTSAMGTEATRQAALEQGAAGYVGKDAATQELETSLERERMRGEERRREHDAQENPAGAGERGTILLVDDHDGFRRAAARQLKKSGFRVREAADGAGAMDAWERGGVDSAIIDIHLPDTSGLEVARLMHVMDPCTTVSLISGEANREEKKSAMRYGILGCVDKADGTERLARIADFLVKSARANRAAAARAAGPPDPWPVRARRWIRRSMRHVRRPLREEKAKVTVAALAFATVLAISLLHLMAQQERVFLTEQFGRAPAERKTTSLFEMYDRIAGYLERDEQRELNQGRGENASAR